MYGGVHLRNGRLLTQQWEEFNGETFGEFLKYPIRPRPRGKKMVIIRIILDIIILGR